MAIVKCSTCGKNVPDTDGKCPNCDNDLRKAVRCLKCGSDDTSILLKCGDSFKAEIFGIFLSLFASWRTARRVYRNCKDEVEYKTTVKHICNNCGKKFKIK